MAMKRNNGLTVISTNTGSGKSYNIERNIARFLAENLKKECEIEAVDTSNKEDDERLLKKSSEKKMVVIIPDKVNFPKLANLKPHLMKYMPDISEAEAFQIIQQNVLIVQNNLDCMCDGLTNHEEELLAQLKDMKTGSTFKQGVQGHIDVIKRYMHVKNVIQGKESDSLYRDMKDEWEQKARQSVSEIQKILKGYLLNYKKQINLAKEQQAESPEKAEALEANIKEWDTAIFEIVSFTKLLYKNAKINDYKVYILTVEKFMNIINPIVERSFFMTSPDFLANKIIIMDESDSAYTKMRNVMIEKVTDSTYEFLDMMSELTQRTFHSQLDANVRNAMNDAFPRKSGVARLENLLEAGDAYFNDFHIAASFKTDESFEKQGYMPAILNDGNQYNLGGGKNFIQATYNEEKEKVILTPLRRRESLENSSEDDAKNVIDVVALFHDGDVLVKRFKRFLDETAKSYLENKLKLKAAKKYYSKEHMENDDNYIDENYALWTVMNVLKMNDDKRKIFANVIKKPYRDVPMYLDDPNFINKDYSYYETGYDIKMIKDNPMMHAENSKIYCYLAKDTPEKVLLTMARYANVILLSATAKNRSINENFSLRYLKDSLQGDYHEVSEQGAKDLKAFYDYRNQKYATGDWKIDVVALPKNTSPAAKIQAMACFQNRKHMKKVVERIDGIANVFGNTDVSYICNRYYNLVIALYDFIKSPILKSMVCLEKPELKLGESYKELTSKNAGFNGELVKDVIKEICKDIGVEAKDILILSAVSRNFKEQIEKMQAHWSEGKKGIFFSTFATTAKGSNLQYLIPENSKIENNLVKLAPELEEIMPEKYKKKDIDCLYMGCYTYATCSISPNAEERDKSFHEVLFETEKACAEYQIPVSLKRMRIQHAYALLERFDDNQQGLESIANTDGIRNSYNKYIKQCVGRMDRVNMKNSLQKIYIESTNLEKLDRKELEETVNELIPGVMAIKKFIDNKRGELDNSVFEKSKSQMVLYKASVQHKKSVNNFRLLLRTIRSSTPDKQQKAIHQYETLRRLVLCHPILTEEEFERLSGLEKGLVHQYYIDTERNDVEAYQYHTEKGNYASDKDDLDVVVEWFNGEVGEIDAVQSRKTLLETALKVKGASALFDAQHYAKEWKPGRYILTPKGVDIYNGILGEVIAKLVMERVLDKLTPVEPKIKEFNINEPFVPELYEKFDFRFGRLYIDIKNWQYGLYHRIDMDERTYRKRIEEKRDECDAVYGQKGIAAVINVFPRESKYTNENLIKSDNYIEIRRLINEDGSEDAIALQELTKLFLQGVTNESTDK